MYEVKKKAVSFESLFDKNNTGKYYLNKWYENPCFCSSTEKNYQVEINLSFEVKKLYKVICSCETTSDFLTYVYGSTASSACSKYNSFKRRLLFSSRKSQWKTSKLAASQTSRDRRAEFTSNKSHELAGREGIRASRVLLKPKNLTVIKFSFLRIKKISFNEPSSRKGTYRNNIVWLDRKLN